MYPNPYALSDDEQELEDDSRRASEWIAEQYWIDEMLNDDSLFASMPVEEEIN
jgi:hypothetical protein